MRKIKDNNTPLLIVIMLFFTIGLILGAISYFRIPDEILDEVSVSFEEGITESDFFQSMKENFIMEIIWIISVWILNNMSFTAPLSGAVIAIRGFLIGFSVTFILMMKSTMKWRMLFANILPQALVAIPALTIFTILLIRLSVERRERSISDMSYFLAGAGFSLISIITSAVETLLYMLFY